MPPADWSSAVVRQQCPELLINQNIARSARTYAVADRRMRPLDVLIQELSLIAWGVSRS
jgi:hypothetical protein